MNEKLIDIHVEQKFGVHELSFAFRREDGRRAGISFQLDVCDATELSATLRYIASRIEKEFVHAEPPTPHDKI